MIYLAPTIFLALISNKRPPLGPFPSKNPSSFMMIFHFFDLKRLSNNVFIIKKSGFLEDLKIDLISAHPRASEIYLAPWALIRSFTVYFLESNHLREGLYLFFIFIRVEYHFFNNFLKFFTM